MRKINGKPVVDATESITIHITKNDCAEGKRRNENACAAARAIIRDYEVTAARVHIGVTLVEQKDYWLRYITPASLRTEIVVYDRGGHAVPGTHVLQAPSPGMTLAHIRKSRKNKKDDDRGRHDKNTKKQHRHQLTGVRQYGANR